MSQMDEVKEPPPPPPPSPATTVEGDAVAEEPIYEVEEILKSRRRNGQYQYYLRWKGFDESYNTWEPEENLYSPELLEEYWSKVGHTKKITGTSKPKARKQKEKKTPKVKDEPEKCDSGPSETSKKSTGRKKQAKDGDDDWEEPKVKRMARGTKRKIKDDDLAKEAPVAKKARSNKKTSTAVQADVHNVSAQFVMVGAQGTPAKTNDATQDPVVLQPFRETTNDEPSLLLDLSINSTFSAEPQASSTLHAKDIQCTPSNVLQLPVAKENLPVSKLFKDQLTEASISQRHHENSNSLKSLSPGKNNPKVVEFKIKKKSAVNRSHLGKKGKTNTESDTQQSSTSSGVGNSEPAPYSAAIMEVANLPIFIPSKSMSLASASMLVPITSKSKAPSSEVAIKAPDAVADTDAVEFNTSSTLSHENQTAAASANEMNIGIRLRNRMHDEHSSHLDSESAVHLSLVEEDMVDFYLEELENSVLPLTPPSQKVLSEDKVMPPELSPADKHAMPGCIAQNLPRNWIGSPPGNPPQLVELDSEELQVPKIVECWGGADMSPLSVEQQLSVTAMPLQTRTWSESNCKTPELITIDDNSSSTASSSSTVEAPDMNCQQTSSAVDPGWMLHEVFSWNHLSYL